MKLNELTKFSISITCIPIVPAILLYKYISLKAAIITLLICWFIALLTFVHKGFAQILKTKLNAVGAFLGKHIANIVLFLIFIFAVIPTKLFIILFKRDRLKRRSFDEQTYWIDCNSEKHDYELEY